MKKFLVLMMAVVVLSASLIGCNKEKDSTVAEGEKVLIKLEDRNIYLNEAIFYALNRQGQYESQFGTDVMSQVYGEGTVGDMVKSQALESTEGINLTAYEAEKTGITLTDEEKQAEIDKAKTYFESIDQPTITQYGFTLELVQDIFLKYAISNKYIEAQSATIPIDEVALQEALDTAALNDAYYASIVKYGAEGSAVSVRAKNILIKTVDDEMSPLPQEQIDAALVKAKEVLEKAKAGEDFAALMTEYSEDPGSLDAANVDGYVFARAEFMPEFEEAAYSMEPGDISEIVETSYGYHIIKLEEKDIAPTEEKLKERTDYEANIISQAKSVQTSAYLEDQIVIWKEKYKVTIDTALWETFIIKGQTGSTEATSEVTTDTSTEAGTEAVTEAATEATTAK